MENKNSSKGWFLKIDHIDGDSGDDEQPYWSIQKGLNS
jgi:hypothetical protein